MKKMFYFAAVALAAVSMSACTGSKTADSSSEETRAQKEVYTGILPSADTDGVRYELKLDYSNDSTFNSGVYDLDETYLKADTLSSTGYKDLDSFKSKGDFTVMKDGGNSYLKLVEKEANDSVKTPAMYFLVESDSTLVMVNSELEKSVNPDLNYTLKLKK